MSADIVNIPVSAGKSAQAWTGVRGDTGTILVWNSDTVNTVYVGFNPQVSANGLNTIPVPPNGSFNLPASRNVFVIGTVSGVGPLVVIPDATGMFRSLTQGLGALAIPSVFSPGFIAGVIGWIIRKDGSAEFNNLVIRGTFFGLDFEINVNGIFFYSGVPALGNLIISVARAAGADEFGNAYSQGIVVYAVAAGSGVQLTGSRVNLLGVGSATIGFMEALAIPGVGSRPQFTISGPSNNDQVPQVLLFGESQDGSALPQVRIQAFSLASGQGVPVDVQVNGTVHGTQPNTQLEETWHSLGTLAGYVVNAARYRITENNEVEFDINVTGTGVNAASVAFSVVLGGSPANYRPTVNGKTYPLATNLTIAAMTSMPRLGITTAGVVTIAGTVNIAVGINYVGGCFMPLD